MSLTHLSRSIDGSGELNEKNCCVTMSFKPSIEVPVVTNF